MRESPSHPGDGHRLRRTPGAKAESVHGSAGAHGLDWPVESGKRQADVGRGGGEIRRTPLLIQVPNVLITFAFAALAGLDG
jgi:hypothetical protein